MKTNESPRTAEEILGEAEKTSNSEKRQRILAYAVKALVEAGRLDLAKKAIKRIRNPYWLSTTFRTLLSKLHESGEFGESRRVIERTLELSGEIKNVLLYVRTLVNISEAFAQIDCEEKGSEVAKKALNVISETKDVSKLLPILPSVVKVLAQTGNISKAQEEAVRIEDDNQRSLAFKYLVRALASREKIGEALKFADRIKDGEHRSQAYMYIGLALLRARRGDEARAIAEEIRNPYWRSHILEWSKKIRKTD